jgi:hypothetical protein
MKKLNAVPIPLHMHCDVRLSSLKFDVIWGISEAHGLSTGGIQTRNQKWEMKKLNAVPIPLGPDPAPLHLVSESGSLRYSLFTLF